MLRRALSKMLGDGDVKIMENLSLKNRSSMRIETYAEFVVAPETKEALCRVLALLIKEDVPFTLIGGMSNTLFKDKIYKGIVVLTDKLRGKSRAECDVSLDCGVRLGGALRYFAMEGLGGAEELFHIPGTLGGAVYSNAGAYGKEISDFLIEAELYSAIDKKVITLSSEGMDFSYRDSLLKKRLHYLLSARLRLAYKPYSEILENANKFFKMRAESQPLEYPTLGSIFKRVQGIGAGFYIEQSGAKGLRVGGAQISEKHAGFIINRGGASACDVLKLIEKVKNKVFVLFGITLDEEIEII